MARAADNSEKRLLGVEDVAEIVGVGEATVWRWCREGTLPCLKVRRSWRVRREALDEFLRQGERPATLVGRLGSFLAVPDNVLVVAENPNLLHRMDAAFFRVGEERGGVLVKFYGGERAAEDGLRARLEEEGLEVGRLEREGRFFLRPEKDPTGRGDELERLLGGPGEGRAVWASFDWTVRVAPEKTEEQREALAGVVGEGRLVVKTAVMEETIGGWPVRALNRAQASHSGTLWISESGLSLSRTTPLPGS